MKKFIKVMLVKYKDIIANDEYEWEKIKTNDALKWVYLMKDDELSWLRDELDHLNNLNLEDLKITFMIYLKNKGDK